MKAIRWRAVLAALAIFITGGAFGAAIMFGVGVHVIRTLLHPPAGGPARLELAVQRIEAGMTATLRLTPEQQAATRGDLEEGAQAIRTLRAATVQQVQQISQNTTARLASRLTPAQQAVFYRAAERRFNLLGLPFNPEIPPPPKASP